MTNRATAHHLCTIAQPRNLVPTPLALADPQATLLKLSCSLSCSIYNSPLPVCQIDANPDSPIGVASVARLAKQAVLPCLAGLQVCSNVCTGLVHHLLQEAPAGCHRGLAVLPFTPLHPNEGSLLALFCFEHEDAHAAEAADTGRSGMHPRHTAMRMSAACLEVRAAAHAVSACMLNQQIFDRSYAVARIIRPN